jgi:hypothetical protein
MINRPSASCADDKDDLTRPSLPASRGLGWLVAYDHCRVLQITAISLVGCSFFQVNECVKTPMRNKLELYHATWAPAFASCNRAVIVALTLSSSMGVSPVDAKEDAQSR